MSDLYVNNRLTIPAAELRESFVRSSGPGGQNVNKTSSKVELRWSPASSRVLREEDRQRLLVKLRLTAEGDLVVTSERERDQHRNRQDARRKLATLVRNALFRPRTRVRTRPSRSAIERRLKAKRHRSTIKRARRDSGGADSE